MFRTQRTNDCMFVSITQYPNKNVALVASDILHLLISYVDHLQKFPPETPKKIVEVRHIVHPKKKGVNITTTL